MTATEKFKLESLGTKFDIEVDKWALENGLGEVKLSGCWIYLGSTLEEALDKCLLDILKNAYSDNSDVIADYEKGLKDLCQQ
jgi:hypothetical protein